MISSRLSVVTALAWPLRAHAEQPKRRIGVLMSTAADDREGQARHAAFVDGLRELGQTEGRNVQIDTRWPVGDAARSRSAEELIALAPDVVLASGSANVTALQRITRSVPMSSRMSSTGWGRARFGSCNGRAATLPALARLNTA